MGLRKAIKRFNKKVLNPPARLILYPVFGIFLGLLLKLWSMTIRVRFLGEEKRPDLRLIEKGENYVYVFWHGRQFILFHLLRRGKCAVMTSLSEAGEIQRWVLRATGHSAVRGSSTRGAVSGLVNMIKTVKKGRNCAFAVDGPRGPERKSKPGALQVAAKTGVWILPVSVAFRKAKIMNRLWDTYHLPVPFTLCAAVIGEPFKVPKNIDSDGLEAETARLDQELDRLTQTVDAYVSSPDKK